MRAVSVGRTEIDWEIGMSFRGFASVVVSVIIAGALLQLSNVRRMSLLEVPSRSRDGCDHQR